MKHLKTFESYSINEEEGILGNIRKKFTGHESSDDKASAEKRINDRLAELEEKAKDGKLVFDKELLFKKAKENNFLGDFEERKSAKDGNTFVVYVKKNTPVEDFARKHKTM